MIFDLSGNADWYFDKIDEILNDRYLCKNENAIHQKMDEMRKLLKQFSIIIDENDIDRLKVYDKLVEIFNKSYCKNAVEVAKWSESMIPLLFSY